MSAENAKTDSTSEFHTKFDEGDETESTRESRRIELEELSRDPDVYDKLTVSVALKKEKKKKGETRIFFYFMFSFCFIFFTHLTLFLFIFYRYSFIFFIFCISKGCSCTFHLGIRRC